MTDEIQTSDLEPHEQQELAQLKLRERFLSLKLEQAQSARETPLAGECSQAFLARRFGLPETTIRRDEHRAIIKFAYGLKQKGLTAHELRPVLRRLIEFNDNDQ